MGSRRPPLWLCFLIALCALCDMVTAGQLLPWALSTVLAAYLWNRCA